MQPSYKTELDDHVVFCARGDLDIALRGSQAELDTVQYLVTNLKERKVGKYQILVNYNMPIQSPGAAGTLEIDLVVINRFGVFLIEVKDWQGIIEGYSDYWLLGGLHRHTNALLSIDNKARILHSCLFGRAGELYALGDVSVVGLVVLARGTRNFKDHCNCGDRVVDLGPMLAGVISERAQQHDNRKRGLEGKELEDSEILRIRNALYKEHEESKEVVVRGYRIIKDLSPGVLFGAFEAVNVSVPALRVRIKRYQLDDISSTSGLVVERFTQSAKAVSRLGPHPNILQTYDFFPDPNRPHVFYEVTELPRGERLDEFMANCHTPLSFELQLGYIEPLCQALIHAHKHNVYHRNLNPEAIFVTRDRAVKLADFDFAKIVGEVTIVHPGQAFVQTPATAPEMVVNASAASPATDIFSLGALWYFLASLPEKSPQLALEKIDSLKLPKAARGLMKRMLAKAIMSRPQEVEEVLRQLTAIREGKIDA